MKPNTVYLLPMKEMINRQRRLLLNDRDPRLGLTSLEKIALAIAALDRSTDQGASAKP